MSSDISDAPGCRNPLYIGVVVVLSLMVAGGAGIVLAFLAFEGLMNPNPAPPGGAGGGGGQPTAPAASQAIGVPPISDRYFGSGQSQATVSGDFSLSSTLEIDTIRSYAADGLAWIGFESGTAEVLVALNEPEDSVTVERDGTSVTGIDDDCVFQIEVTPALVSGHISCASVDVVRAGEVTGQASIELDFSAATASEQ